MIRQAVRVYAELCELRLHTTFRTDQPQSAENGERRNRQHGTPVQTDLNEDSLNRNASGRKLWQGVPEYPAWLRSLRSSKRR